MDWLKVNDLEELKKLGSFNEVRGQIKEEGWSQLHVSGRSWQGLLDSIREFREKVEKLQQLTTGECVHSLKGDVKQEAEAGYFNSRASEYIFYLTELDGELRLKKLGVNASHFSSKKAAKAWREQISKVIHPDFCSHQQATAAMAKLNDLYQQMVGRD